MQSPSNQSPSKSTTTREGADNGRAKMGWLLVLLTVLPTVCQAVPAADRTQTGPRRQRPVRQGGRFSGKVKDRRHSGACRTGRRGVRFGRPRCRPDYWILSTRRCRQFDRPSSLRCCLRVVHRCRDGCYRRASLETLLGSLQSGVPVCIVVHGSFIDPETVRHYSREVSRWIRRPAPHRRLHMIFLTWPSDGLLTFLPAVDLPVRGRRSAFNAFYLTRLIRRIPAEHPICLMGHSHGARMVAASLHLLAGGMVQGNRLRRCKRPDRRLRAVLTAAAMEHHWLNPGSRYGRAVDSVEALLSLRNREDLPLWFYPLRRPFGRPALGRRGFTPADRAALGHANPKIAELDVTPLIETGHRISHYYSRPSLARLLRPYLDFTDRTADEREMTKSD